MTAQDAQLAFELLNLLSSSSSDKEELFLKNNPPFGKFQR